MNRKQKALEERYKAKGECFWKKPKYVDLRKETSVEEVIKIYKRYIHYGYTAEIIRKETDRVYKNGGNTFDLAMKLLDSPLYEALG
jgi:hypothetical protein